MISTDYSLYVTNAINITRSLIIKQNISAITLNKTLADLGDEIPESPYNWKYYLNLAGIKYDVGNTYTANDDIHIKSLDTNSIILLTVTSIENHPITKNELLSKGMLYQKLLLKYPDEVFYIDGILNPIDLNKSVEAEDFTILWYNEFLLEKQEINLIPKIQEWLYNFTYRWFNYGYCLTDKWYPYVFIGDIFLNIVLLILNIRLENCKTTMAHSYHIWNYLGGYFKIDSYRASIPHEQAMFLYLNIEYLIKNSGTQKNLEIFNQGLLIPSRLTLKKYDIIHNVKSIFNQISDDQNSIIIPDIFGIKRELTNEDNLVKVEDIETLEKTIQVLNPLAKLNNTNVDSQQNLVKENTVKTIYTNIPTGILEISNVPDPANELVDVLREKIFQWFYLANEDYIKFNYTIGNILEIPNIISISPRDTALILIAIDKLLRGESLTTIPTIVLQNVADESYLTDEQILNLIEKKYYLKNYLNKDKEKITWNLFDYSKSILAKPELIFNTDDFSIYSKKLISMRIQHILMIGSEPEPFGKSQLKTMLNCFNRSVELNLTPFTNFNNFFLHLGVDLRTLSEKTLKELMISLLVNHIGLGKETIETEDLIKGVLGILKQLTSYTLQYTYSLNDTRVSKVDWPTAGITDLTKNSLSSYAAINIENKIGVNTLQSVDINANEITMNISTNTKIYPYIDELFDSTVLSNINILCQLEDIVENNIYQPQILSGEEL